MDRQWAIYRDLLDLSEREIKLKTWGKIKEPRDRQVAVLPTK